MLFRHGENTMKRTLQRKVSLAIAMGIVLTALATTTALAQWMGGSMGQDMRGGGMCRMMDITPQPVDPATLSEPASAGAQILKSKCRQCHGLVSPRQHASQDWPYIVDRMDRRMRMMAGGEMGMMMRSNIQPLSQEEKNTLLTYLQQNAFKAMGASDLPGSGEPGGQAFAQICSQCHALPDPAAYTSEEWKNIVERMAGNMENMGVGSLAPEQKKAILGYLEKNARGE